LNGTDRTDFTAWNLEPISHTVLAAASLEETETTPATSCPLPASRANASWPINSIVPPIPYDRDRGNMDSDVSPSIFVPLDRVWEALSAAFPKAMSNFVVNVGAANGVSDDPLWPLMVAHGPSGEIGGVFVEYKKEAFEQLRASYAQFPYAQLLNAAMQVSTSSHTARGKNASSGPYPSQDRSLDVFKFDIDSCDGHYLEEMLKDPFYRAKVVQIETNHHITPPIHWRDMCLNDVNGRDGTHWDVWGLSAQAAYDVIKPYGYSLLQYAWPDVLFIKNEYLSAFPCMTFNFEDNYWLGYWHARNNYARFNTQQSNRNFVASFPALSNSSLKDPHSVLQLIHDTFHDYFGKNELWIDVGITGTGVRGSIFRDSAGAPKLTFDG